MKILSSIFKNIKNKKDMINLRTIYFSKDSAKLIIFKWKHNFGIKINLSKTSFIMHLSEMVVLTLFSLKCIDEHVKQETIISKNFSVHILQSIAMFHYFNMPLFQCSRAQLIFVLLSTKSIYKNDLIKSSIIFRDTDKPFYICNEIVKNLTEMHKDVKNSKIVFMRWKNMCSEKCYFLKYNSDSEAETNLYKYCNNACISFDIKSIIGLFNLSLIRLFQEEEEAKQIKEMQKMYFLQKHL